MGKDARWPICRNGSWQRVPFNKRWGTTSAYHLAKGWATKDGQPECCESEAQVPKLRGPGKGFCSFVSPPRPPPFEETSACHSMLLKAAEGISRSHLLFRHDTGKFRKACRMVFSGGREQQPGTCQMAMTICTKAERWPDTKGRGADRVSCEYLYK